jgi:hypothetical protein
MRFTGKNLELMESALSRAISDVQMTIGSCPDVVEFADDLEFLEREKSLYEQLFGRVQAARTKEHQERNNELHNDR